MAESIISSRAALPVCLGYGNPHRLVSLLDIVNQFNLYGVLGALRQIECVEHRCEHLGTGTLTADDLANLHSVLAFASGEMKKICLLACVSAADGISLRIAGNKDRAAPRGDSVAGSLITLRAQIEETLRSRKFIWIAEHRSDYLDHNELFGKAVNEAFPSARQDIAEAGNCLAVEFPTAAIFHLMRVAETGLRCMARDRCIPMKSDLDLSSWEELLQGIEKAEDKIRAYPKNHARERQLAFYHGAMQEVRAFKGLFRNRVMHSRESYDINQALSAFEHVKTFMRGLSEYISESSPPTPEIWHD